MDSFNNFSQTHHPYVTFVLKGQPFCISSGCVLQMVIKTDLVEIPGSPPYIPGVLNVRGEIFPVLDLRLLFNMGALEQEVAAFSVMKDKHLDWVVALEKSVAEGSPFQLARDPHQCAFGQWYDGFQTDNHAIQHILNKIYEPHRQMHNQAVIIDACKSRNDQEGIQKASRCAEQLCHDVIVPLLDDLIAAYKDEHRGMMMLMGDGAQKMALLVDNITSIEAFANDQKEAVPPTMDFEYNRYIQNIIISSKNQLILELDAQALFDLSKQ